MLIKRVALILCCCIVLALFSGYQLYADDSVDAAEIILGDVDKDGEITTVDYMQLKFGIINEFDYTEDELLVADVNYDGSVTTADLVLIKAHIVGKVVLTCSHSYSSWVDTGIYNCAGEMTTSRTCTLCGKVEESVSSAPSQIRSIDGKTVMFIGNSFIYYGYCVNNGSQKSKDKGYFKQICTENGESVDVYDYVWGGRNLDYIYENYLVDCTTDFLESVDYVFISEAGENNSGLASDVQKIMDLFPSSTTEFYYLCHAYTYQAGHSNIKNAFSTLQSKGVEIVNWGQLVYNVWQGTESVPGAKETYSKTTFIVNKNDTHHQNMLSGYITAQMAYCAITGKSAVGQSYLFCNDTTINSKYDSASYISSYYNSGTTNFDDVFNSVSDMLGLQQLIDKYLKKYNLAPFIGGTHSYEPCTNADYDGALTAAGLAEEKCTVCGGTRLVEDGAKGDNLMYVSADAVSNAGYSTVKEYMLAGLGNVFYKTTAGWGRSGYASIQGMAAACDGVRSSNGKKDGTEMYWKTNAGTYNANAGTPTDGETSYAALIGYDMTSSVTAKGVGVFFNRVNAPTAFDILGGVTASDGTIEWKVLASFDSASQSYITYDDMTVAFFADFDATQFDCVQLGLKSIRLKEFYMSELELYK